MQGPFRLVTIVVLLTLAGCATVDQNVDPVVSTSDAQDAISEAPEPPEDLPEKVNIKSDSLQPLLEAEFAIRARDYDHALKLLESQVMAIPDPELARRMLRLAQFLRDQEAATNCIGASIDLDHSDAEASHLRQRLRLKPATS